MSNTIRVHPPRGKRPKIYRQKIQPTRRHTIHQPLAKNLRSAILCKFAAPPGALVPPPQRAKPARKSARCGVVDGSPHPHPPHQQPVGRGPRPHASRTGGWAWENAQPRTPHTQARGAPPRGPLCCPHSAQSQLARARAVRFVTGAHAHTSRTHSLWVADPDRTPQGRTVERGRAPNLGRRTPRQGAPTGRLRDAPTARKASSQERAPWGW